MSLIRSPFIIALLGAYTLVVSHGIGRFLYTTTLPSILEQTSVTTLISGYLASANYTGYLIGAILAMFIPKAKSAVSLQIGMVLCLVSTFALLIELIPLWYLARFISGLGAGLVLVNGSALILSQFPARKRTLYNAIYYSGVGFGVVITSVIVLVVNSIEPNYSNMWLVGGLISLPAAWIVWKFGQLTITEQTSEQHSLPKNANTLRWLVIISYALGGFGYISSATYLPVMVMESLSGQSDIPENIEMWVFIVVGVSVICISPFWGKLAHHYGEIKSLCAAILLQITSLLIPVYFTEITMLIIAAILFGSSFMAIVSLSMGAVKHLSTNRINYYLGLATVCYSVGQILGPLVTVYLNEAYGSLNYGALAAAGVYSVALAILIMGVFIENKT